MFNQNILCGYNDNYERQLRLLEMILFKNDYLWTVLKRISSMENKTMYLASGSISQTVWNYQNKSIPDLMYGISDFDIVYYDEDTSYEKEDTIIKQVQSMMQDIPVPLDIKNQARVHIWTKEKWNRDMTPYTSVQDAISSWSSTASCIGVQLVDGKMEVFAPYGLNDTFGQIMRPNREKVPREMYDNKVKKWTSKWNFLNVIPW